MSNPIEVEDRSELDLDTGWSIGEEPFAKILELARARNARRILEFGGGASTVRWALGLPEARIVSVEHDPVFCARTAELVARHGVADRVELCPAPLDYWWHRGRAFFTYDVDLPAGPYDFVLIDGPPGYLITGRQACLHRCFPHLADDATVVLDDFEERREQRTALRWREAYPGAFEVEEWTVGHRLLVLRKVRDAELGLPGAGEIVHNTLDNLQSLGGRLRHRLGDFKRSLAG